jgi:beta-lactamase regulating signal transducer with metallopeptidase domain
MSMEGVNIAAILGLLGLLGAGIGVWVSLRERLVRAETKIETLEKLHSDQKSETAQLRDWLDAQFHELRKVLAMKADR